MSPASPPLIAETAPEARPPPTALAVVAESPDKAGALEIAVPKPIVRAPVVNTVAAISEATSRLLGLLSTYSKLP